MERKHFLKSLLVGVISSPALLSACGQDSEEVAPTTDTGSGACTVAPTETEGPFPTKAPASYVRSNIVDGKTGHPLTVKITIKNSSNSCAVLSGALVDIWHCDAEGSYSEYGGNGMQPTNYQAVHFLRGRQITDANGLVTFTTIFPGWYNGRATHIHVHIYSASGTSLKVTQIAFPEGAGTALAAVNGYAKGLSGYTYNSNDGIFRDDTAGLETATITGSTSAGFELAITLSVAV